MKTKLFFTICTFCFLSTSSIFATTYYVSTAGNNSNNGTSISTPWRTITFAASNSSAVSAGDTIYIKAGNYGSENIAFQTSGTISSPIIYEGYQAIPGDNPNLNYTFGDALNALVMPLLDGGDRFGAGIAITLYSKQYVTLKNLQITNYNTGIDGWNASNCTIENVIATTFGNYNSPYDGKCISFSPNGSSGGENNTIKNCVFSNASAEGISVTGNNNTIKNCKVYCDENYNDAASMDYYIIIGGNNNVIENCYVERVGNLDHGGHGICVKENCENNLVLNCTSKGMEISGYQLRHRGVKNNTLENCLAINCGFTIRDGASHNLIKNCKSINAKYGAIGFNDSSEDGGAQYAGRHNIFENCIFEKTQGNVINFFYWSLPSICDSNTFVNCVFDGGGYLFNCDRENNYNKMINCVVSNVQNYYQTQQDQGIAYPINFSFEYTNFWNNGFSMVPGTGNIASNPLFVDPVNGDFHLQIGSPCIDQGSSTGAPLTDFEGTSRPQGIGFDIGAYEYSITTEITEHASEDFFIFPNPTTGKIYIPTQFLNKDYQIHSMVGSLVKKGTIRTKEIDLSTLKPGIYFLKIERESEKNNTIRLIKK